jgi:hypothetical protein
MEVIRYKKMGWNKHVLYYWHQYVQTWVGTGKSGFYNVKTWTDILEIFN